MVELFLARAFLGISVLCFSGVPAIQQGLVAIPAELQSPSVSFDLRSVTESVSDTLEKSRQAKVEQEKPVKPKEYITSTAYDFITIGGSVSKSNFDLMLSYYCKIPLPLREEFQVSGWVLSMTDEHLEDTWFTYLSVPVCAGSNSMLREIRLEDSNSGAKAVIHEFGHYYSWSHGNLHITDEFINLYSTEGSLVSSYSGTNPDECFAESFDMYISNPEKLQSNAPSISQYFKNLLGN